MLLLRKCLRQNLDQLHKDVCLSFSWAIESSITKMLNQHPVFNFLRYQVKQIKRKLPNFRLMRGKATKKLVCKNTQVWLNQTRHYGNYLQKKSQSVSCHFCIRIIRLFRKHLYYSSTESILGNLSGVFLNYSCYFRKSCLPSLPLGRLTWIQ